jgi:hypothetical protein
VLPVLRATYDLMEELQSDALDGDVLLPRLSEDGHDESTLYNIFRLHGAP